MNKHTTRIIDGTFTADKAKELLIELIDHKINFHNMEKFSHKICYGEDLEHSEKRIKELTNEKQSLMEWLNNHKETDTIKINCKINLETIN